MTVAFPAPVAADRYDAALSALVPLKEPENIRRLRKRLMTSRDLATRALSNPEGHIDQALVLHQSILDLASAYVARLQDLGGLEDAANLCVRLLNEASTLDRMGGGHA
jgi:hypothetical protein